MKQKEDKYTLDMFDVRIYGRDKTLCVKSDEPLTYDELKYHISNSNTKDYIWVVSPVKGVM